MPKAKKVNEKLISQRIDNFSAKGPYTAAEFLAVAQEVVHSTRYQMADTLSEILFKFPPPDLQLIMAHCRDDESIQEALGESIITKNALIRLDDEQIRAVYKYLDADLIKQIFEEIGEMFWIRARQVNLEKTDTFVNIIKALQSN